MYSIHRYNTFFRYLDSNNRCSGVIKLLLEEISQSTGVYPAVTFMTLALSISMPELRCVSRHQGRSDLRPSVTFKEGVLLTQEILLHQSMMDTSTGKTHMWADI